MERAAGRGVLPALRENMGRGLREEENPGNLLHLDKQNMHMNGWELAGTAIS